MFSKVTDEPLNGSSTFRGNVYGLTTAGQEPIARIVSTPEAGEPPNGFSFLTKCLPPLALGFAIGILCRSTRC